MSFYQRTRENARIIWALTVKDMTDAIKNRTTLTIVLSALLMAVIYRFIPAFAGDDERTNLLIYDASESSLVASLEESLYLEVYTYPSQERMEQVLASGDVPELGLVVPAGIDQALAAGQAPEIPGYVVHWVGRQDARELVALVEDEIISLAGQPARIEVGDNRVYPRADSGGYPFLTSVALIYVTTMIGVTLVPHLMFEERQNKTLDALLVSPAGSGQIVLGKGLTGLIYTMLSITIVLLVNPRLVVNWPLALLAALCGAGLGVMLGLLLGTTVKVKEQLAIWLWVLIVPLLLPVFLSMLPGLLPEPAISVVDWMPTVALSRVFRLSFSDRAPLAQFGPELALVAGCTALVYGLVAWIVGRSDR
ncbi:MAG: ABC transporter permease [Anaerolineae bacterium]|jgi:ABC-2 type transport system permease protein